MPATDDDRIDLRATLRRAADAHRRPKEGIRHLDPDWPGCYAPYMVHAQSGRARCRAST